MSGTSELTTQRDAALESFDAAARELEQAFQAVPDEALRYKPEGDDYTLGGLAVHVAQVLRHYGRVLELVVAAGFGEVRAGGPHSEPGLTDEMIRSGFSGSERPAVFQALRAAHEGLAATARGLSADQFARKAPVYYGPDAREPYPTAAADVLVWVTDHYREHVTQVGELVQRWRATAS